MGHEGTFRSDGNYGYVDLSDGSNYRLKTFTF